VTLWLIPLLCVSVACNQSPSPPPIVVQVSGTLALDGLSSPVRVLRDRWGVPHIYAQTRDDLFFAQGFTQAQDRLFQMDLWRRSVQGRLSQVLGANFIERDAMTRRVQYRGDLDAEWASYGPEAKAIAAAFVRGVNAWVALARERPPEEFGLAGWTPEFWTTVDLLNRTDLFVESRGTLDAGQWASAGPPAAEVIADALRRVGAPPFFVGLAADVRPRVGAELPRPDATERAPDRLAPRLDHPSRRYLVHLHAPGWNTIGATAPWLPGVAIGHDDRAAWDTTSARIAPPSIVVVKVNPDNAHQIDGQGRWIDAEVVKDIVIVKRRTEPFAYESLYTLRGVIVATDTDRHLAFVVQWRGVDAGAIPALHALTADRSSLPRLLAVASGPSTRSAAFFSHPLGISADAGRRFNVGPLSRPADGAGAFQISVKASDWDRSTAMNAPGQSESPDSAHFKDLAAEWAAGKSVPLPFSDRAVDAATETTLLLTPRRP
jgi:penicillin amidase